MVYGELGAGPRIGRTNSSSGCGFLTEKHGLPHLLHAHALRRKVIEEPYTGEWLLKVKLAFRFRQPSITA